jgi:hypothetical protein
MSLSKNLRQTQDASPRPSTPNASGTVTAGSRLERDIQIIRAIFLPQHDDDEIRKRLGNAWFIVHGALLEVGDSIVNERLKNESEFNADVGRGSKGERKLIALLRSMAKEEVPWRELFENGTLLSSDAKYANHHILSLEAFLKPELEKRTDPATAHGA